MSLGLKMNRDFLRGFLASLSEVENWELYKICAGCQIPKPLSEYGFDKNARKGLSSYCNKCVRVKAAEYRKNNRLLLRTKQREYASTRKEQYAQCSRRWRVENRERWNERGRKAKLKRRVGKNSESLDYALILRNDPCSYCNKASSDIDHIDPVSIDGSNNWDNLTTACRSCNAQKSNKRMIVFLAER